MVRLVLGSAQWGGRYGVANRTGQPSFAEVMRILAEAWEAGIRTIDTAQAYGPAEEWLGGREGSRFQIVTKIRPSVVTRTELTAALEESRTKLQRDILDVVLLHDPAQRDREEIWRGLLDARERGRVGAVGVSVRSVAQADDQLAGLDAIQVPASLLDQRLARSSFFERAGAARVRVFVRSVFLQGAVALPPGDLPHHLRPLAPSLARLRNFAAEMGLELPELLLLYARERYAAEVLVGCETVEQLHANLKAWRLPPLGEQAIRALEALVDDLDESVLNPAEWPT